VTTVEYSALGFHRVSDLEFAAGWVPGYLKPSSARPLDAGSGSNPVAVLERVLLDALLQRPCVIGFSGGRDSSALLAVAMRVARREGLAPPVALTNVYPKVPSTDEREWQELVVRWLGVEEWVRHDYDDELDLLGPAATSSLRQHGLLWPGSAHNRQPQIEVARGGCYIDGEGGDEVLGSFRITPVTRVLARARTFDRRARRDAVYALAPGRLRRGVATRQVERGFDRTWLRPAAAEWCRSTSVDDILGASLPYPKALKQLVNRRATRIAMGNLDAIGRSLSVTYVHPFYDPEFVAALGAFGGRLGLVGRTAVMRALFADLLPDEVNARQTKAYFNDAFIHGHSRTFVESWDGTGLDPELVDADVLREMWSKPYVHSGTFQLMQAAWLASQEPAA
jgi:hypothetical protein